MMRSEQAAGDRRGVQIEYLNAGKACLVKLSGVIDERFDGAALVAGAHGVVVIDLDGVRGITSSGVRDWVRAMRDLRADYLGFVRCRPSIVDQFNLVAGFAGGGELLSLYLPYTCARCRDFEVILDATQPLATQGVGGGEPPMRPCPTCGDPSEFDDVAATYFQFVVSQPTPKPPELVHAILAGAAESPPLTVEKEISGGVTPCAVVVGRARQPAAIQAARARAGRGDHRRHARHHPGHASGAVGAGDPARGRRVRGAAGALAVAIPD